MEKNDYKKYLITVIALLFGSFALTFILTKGLTGRQETDVILSTLQVTLISVGCALITAGSYTGFVFFGSKITELNKKQMFLIVFLFPLVLAIITVSGIILIIPYIIYSFIKIFRG